MFDTMTMTKAVAGLCLTLLIFLLLQWGGDALYHKDSHGGYHEQAYSIDTGEEEGGEAVVETGPTFEEAFAVASADAGERLWRQCQACHKLEDGANGTGPNLYGIVGKQVASAAGFAYSGALQEFGGVWTYERLDGYLENSSSYIPGTSMAQRIRKDDKRADILAYLQSQGSMDVPFPAPAPVEPVVIETEEEELEAVPAEDDAPTE